MRKAHRSGEEDPRNFFLLEELDVQPETSTSGKKRADGGEKVLRRILSADESVYQSQNEWKTAGHFVLVERDMVDFDQDITVSSCPTVRLQVFITYMHRPALSPNITLCLFSIKGTLHLYP